MQNNGLIGWWNDFGFIAKIIKGRAVYNVDLSGGFIEVGQEQLSRNLFSIFYLFEIVFGRTAVGTDPIIGEILKFRPGVDPNSGFAYLGIVYIIAVLVSAPVLFHLKPFPVLLKSSLPFAFSMTMWNHNRRRLKRIEHQPWMGQVSGNGQNSVDFFTKSTKTICQIDY